VYVCVCMYVCMLSVCVCVCVSVCVWEVTAKLWNDCKNKKE